MEVTPEALARFFAVMTPRLDERQRRFSPLYPSYRSMFADLFGLRLIALRVPVEQFDRGFKPGDLNFIAREMRFQFHRPVFAGDTVKCEARIAEFEPGEEYINVRTDFVCRNQHGKEVMTGHAQGIVRQEG